MGLAEFMVVVMAVVFALGAVLALLWAHSSGQLSDLTAAASIVIDDQELIGWEDINEEKKLRRARDAG
ncbi:MAG: cbb3-type cytochrome oxidase assembly protein CcoS [Firmicutes bacterium]|nr:cbb3-type cytochrome oxidase assembly protein CcoS [Bacillota bacterium]